jgi:hypothetical protein
LNFLSLSNDLTLGVVDVVLELESPRLMSLVRAATTESSVLLVVKSSAVKRAVSTVRLVVLVQEVRVEHLARGEAVLAGLDSGVAVVGVLLNGVVGADLRVEGTGDELAAHVVAGSRDGLGTTVLTGLQGRLLGRGRSRAAMSGRGRSASRRSRGAAGRRARRLTSRRGRRASRLGRRGSVCGRGSGRDGRRDDRGSDRDVRDNARRSSDVGLVVGVRTSDDSLELLTVVTLVGSNLNGERRSPKGTLVVGDGRGVRAVGLPRGVGSVVVVGRGKAGITLNVEVERSAELGSITLGSTVLRVIGGQSVKTDVGVGRNSCVQVLEDLSVLSSVGARNNSSSSRCHRVERSVWQESVNSIGLNLRTKSSRLGRTRVFRVYEPTISSLLGLGRAGGVRVGSRGGNLSCGSSSRARGRGSSGRGSGDGINSGGTWGGSGVAVCGEAGRRSTSGDQGPGSLGLSRLAASPALLRAALVAAVVEDLTLETLVEVERVVGTESTLLEVTLNSAGGCGAGGSDSANSNGADDGSILDNSNTGRASSDLRSSIEESKVEISLGHGRCSGETSDGGQSEGGRTHLEKDTWLNEGTGNWLKKASDVDE